MKLSEDVKGITAGNKDICLECIEYSDLQENYDEICDGMFFCDRCKQKVE